MTGDDCIDMIFHGFSMVFGLAPFVDGFSHATSQMADLGVPAFMDNVRVIYNRNLSISFFFGPCFGYFFASWHNFLIIGHLRWAAGLDPGKTVMTSWIILEFVDD